MSRLTFTALTCFLHTKTTRKNVQIPIFDYYNSSGSETTCKLKLRKPPLIILRQSRQSSSQYCHSVFIQIPIQLEFAGGGKERERRRETCDGLFHWPPVYSRIRNVHGDRMLAQTPTPLTCHSRKHLC